MIKIKITSDNHFIYNKGEIVTAIAEDDYTYTTELKTNRSSALMNYWVTSDVIYVDKDKAEKLGERKGVEI